MSKSASLFVEEPMNRPAGLVVGDSVGGHGAWGASIQSLAGRLAQPSGHLKKNMTRAQGKKKRRQRGKGNVASSKFIQLVIPHISKARSKYIHLSIPRISREEENISATLLMGRGGLSRG